MQIETNVDLNTECSLTDQLKTGVYCITNVISNKIYIGSVIKTGKRKSFRRRWQKHLQELLNNSHCNNHFQSAFNLDGKNAFRFTILEIIDNPEETLIREQYYIDSTNCLNPDVGYNKYPLAICVNKDYKASKETRKKLSNQFKSKPRPMWMKIKYGKPVVQYTLEGEFIQEFYSTMEAERVTKVNRVAIKNCVKGRTHLRKTAGSFIWKYKNIDN